SYYEEAAALCREQGNRTHLAIVLLGIGNVLYELSNYARARPVYEESLALFRQGEQGWVACTCNTLGSTLFHLGEKVRAQALHREALVIYRSNASAEGIAWSLERLGVVESLHGEASRAAWMLGAASAARKGLGKPMDRWDQTDWDRAVSSVRSA